LTNLKYGRTTTTTKSKKHGLTTMESVPTTSRSGWLTEGLFWESKPQVDHRLKENTMFKHYEIYWVLDEFKAPIKMYSDIYRSAIDKWLYEHRNDGNKYIVRSVI